MEPQDERDDEELEEIPPRCAESENDETDVDLPFGGVGPQDALDSDLFWLS